MSDNLEMGSAEPADIHERIMHTMEQPEPVEEAQEKEIETTEEESLEDVEQVDEVEEVETEESELEESTEQEPQEEEASSFQSVDELAEALDLSVDDFADQIKTKVKVDGEESEISLSELRNGYQRDADYRRKTMELADQRKVFESESEALKSDYQSRIQQVNAVSDYMKNQLLTEYQSINWQELSEADPGTAALKMQEFKDRQSYLQQVEKIALQENQRLQTEVQEKQQEEFKKHYESQWQIVHDANPTWSDEKVAQKELGDLTMFFKERGFSDQEIATAADSRYILMALDAMKVNQVHDKAEVVRKKVKTLPKVVKPGSKVSKADAKAKNKQKLRAAIKRGDKSALHQVLLDKV